MTIGIVSGTTLVEDSGTTARLETTLNALREVSSHPHRILAFESPSLLRDRAALFRRRRSFESLGASVSFIPLLSKRGPGGRRAVVAGMGLVLRALWSKQAPSTVLAINADAAAACSMVGSRVTGRQLRVYEMHGVESEEALAAGSVSLNSVEWRQRRWIERRALKWSDHIVCPAVAARAWAEGIGEFTAEWHELPTLTSLSIDAAEVRRYRMEARSSLGWSDKRILVYVGGMNAWQRPELMAETFRELVRREQNWRLLFLTQTPDRAKQCLSSAAIDPSLTRVFTAGRNDVPYWLAAGDLGLLLRHDDLMNRASSPTKFAEYLELGVPVVITSGLPLFARITEQRAVGIAVSADAGAPEIVDRMERFVRSNDRSLVAQRCKSTSRELFSDTGPATIYNSILHLQKGGAE